MSVDQVLAGVSGNYCGFGILAVQCNVCRYFVVFTELTIRHRMFIPIENLLIHRSNVCSRGKYGKYMVSTQLKVDVTVREMQHLKGFVGNYRLIVLVSEATMTSPKTSILKKDRILRTMGRFIACVGSVVYLATTFNYQLAYGWMRQCLPLNTLKFVKFVKQSI